MRDKKLRLGILNADELTPDVEEKFGNYNTMFESLFSNSLFEFNFYQVTQKTFPENINECDAYLISGSKYSAYDNFPWVDLLKEFIVKLNENNRKLIGICFGHQIIAEALGGKVIKSLDGWGEIGRAHV